VYAGTAFIGPGAIPTGGAAGQVLGKNSATNYDLAWVTPSPGGLTLPLTQNLTFSPDTTYDIGAAATSRPRDLFLGRNLTVSGTVNVPNGAIAGAAIADNGVTSAKIADGTIQSVDIASAGVANANLGPDVARANLLTNGGFEIWQRGNGAFAGNGYNADRWISSVVGTDTLSVSRDTTNQDSASGSIACAASTFTLGSGAGSTALFNQIMLADGFQLRNRQVSASIRVRTATANAVRLAGYDGTSWNYSSFHPGGGTYQTLTVTWTPGASATNFSVAVFFAVSCTAYLDNATLVVGSVPATYVPMHPADDLARCLRYYEILQPDLSLYHGSAGGVCLYGLPFRALKAVTPTLTKNGTWSTTNCGQPTVGSRTGAETSTFYFYVTSVAAGNVAVFPSAAGQNITAEANP
jgi:hypothetical protein